MSFSDPDPVEEYLGKSVLEMVDTELVTYIKTYLDAIHDIKLPTTAHKERAIMARFKRTYGEDAGNVVKWALSRGPVLYTDFSEGMKWKTDKWYVELQKHLKQKSKTSAAEGFSRLDQL